MEGGWSHIDYHKAVTGNLTKKRRYLGIFDPILMPIDFLFFILGIPDRPASVTLHTTSSTSLLVDFEEPTICNGAAVTRYKGKITNVCITSILRF